MLKKFCSIGLAIAASSFFCSCSDDSSDGVNPADYDPIEIPVPDDIADELLNDGPSSSASTIESSAQEATPESTDAKTTKSSAEASDPESSDDKSQKTNDVKTPKSSAQEATPESTDAKTPKSSAQASDPESSNDKVPEVEKDWRDACIEMINEYRATENIEPIARASQEKEACVDKQAADDLASGTAHGHFGDCNEGAQNSGPNINFKWQGNDKEKIAQYYLKMMWEDEKALVLSGERDPESKDDYPYIGHYLNMKGKYKTAACGFAEDKDGQTGWLNIDFFSR